MQTRSYFLDELKQWGFKKYHPKGNIFSYLNREHFKRDNIKLSVSPSGTAIEITVVNGNRITRLEDYSSAWNHINDCIKSSESKTA